MSTIVYYVLTQRGGFAVKHTRIKMICIVIDHNIGIAFDSTYLKKDHGVKYGIFSVRLHFNNSAEGND